MGCVLVAMKRILLVALVGAMLLSSAMAEPVEWFDADLLRQANSAAPLAAEYEPRDLVKLVSRRNGGSTEGTVYTASATSIKLREAAAQALVKLCAAAEAEGVILYVRQGYRSYSEEAKRYARLDAWGEAMQMPGECDYQTGLAATVVGAEQRSGALDADFAETAEGMWIAEHATEYGFVLRYPEDKMEITGWDAEPWHIRYVGMEAAEYMRQHGLCLEELWLGAEPVEMEELVAAEEAIATEEPMQEAEMISAPQETAFTYIPGQVVPLDEFGPDGDREISFIFE